MRYLIWIGAISTCLLLSGCPGGKYADLKDAPAAGMEAGKTLWAEYVKALADKKLNEQPELLASFFSRPLIAGIEVDGFAKQVKAARRKRSTGLFDTAKVEALKQAPDGLLLVIDSKAGQVGVPVVEEGGRMKFASVEAACGEWTREAKRGPTSMPQEPSLLYIKMVMADDEAPAGERLRAAVGLAQKRYRHEIIKAQRTIKSRIVRLGLGLARIKIDGSDESFARNFPTDPTGLTALSKADAAIFEEMIVKLTNMGSMIEDPPVNETLYKVAAGAPEVMQARIGKALYDMAEAGPRRFANAVFSVSKDMDNDKALAVYFAEVKRRGGKAPKVIKFLKKFAREGEGPERKLCKDILAQFKKHR